MNIQELPLNIILRILSLLGREDLIEVGACSHLLRHLANHVLLLNNLLLRSQVDWVRSTLFSDMSQIALALEFIWHEDDEQDEEEQMETNEELITIEEEQVAIEEEPVVVEEEQVAVEEEQVEIEKEQVEIEEEQVESEKQQLEAEEKEKKEEKKEGQKREEKKDQQEKEEREEEEQYNNDDDGKFLLDIYGESAMCSSEDTVAYMKILQRVHEEATRMAENDHIGTPEHKDWEIKLERPWKVISPSISDYSKSSVNSTFSELPPRLSSSECSFEDSEISEESDSMTSSVDSLDKLRSSKKVKDKAALFEKLILKDISHNGPRAKTTERKVERKRRRSYRLLAHFFPDRKIVGTGGNISEDYIKEITKCTEEAMFSSAPLKESSPQRTPKAGNSELEEPTEIFPKENNNSKTRGNRLKAFVTKENRICYEKI